MPGVDTYCNFLPVPLARIDWHNKSPQAMTVQLVMDARTTGWEKIRANAIFSFMSPSMGVTFTLLKWPDDLMMMQQGGGASIKTGNRQAQRPSLASNIASCYLKFGYSSVLSDPPISYLNTSPTALPTARGTGVPSVLNLTAQTRSKV